jgi:hypothetical protein
MAITVTCDPYPNPQYDRTRYRECCICGPTIGEGHADIDTKASRIWPEQEMTYWDGLWYCNDHFMWRWGKKLYDMEKFPDDENDLRSGRF